MNPFLHIHPEVQDSLHNSKPVVALESTIIAHGMPYPQNVETAREVESIVRNQGATPATIAILNGKLCVGLNEQQLEQLQQQLATQADDFAVSFFDNSNLGFVNK